MKTVREISRMTGVSVRTLHYYDQIGLLKPAACTEAGYRLYDDSSLERLSQILLYRELEFPLSTIREILDAPDFDRRRALEQQIELLELKRAHLDSVILFARGICQEGTKHMYFSAFDRSKLDEYAKRAKEQWGSTPEYAELQEKEHHRTPEQTEAAMRDLMRIFAEFGALRELPPDSVQVQKQVSRLQAFITEHAYTCTDKILRGLGQMYAAGGELAESIDRAGGEGTAAFTASAIAARFEKKS